MKKDQVRFESENHATIRRQDGRVEVGTFHEMREGQPMPDGAELVQIDYRPNSEWHDSKTLYKNGPSQVATPKYREGYDRIFGKKEVGLA
jgi:hypothetical protein